jgi:hypothetical protein
MSVLFLTNRWVTHKSMPAGLVTHPLVRPLVLSVTTRLVRQNRASTCQQRRSIAATLQIAPGTIAMSTPSTKLGPMMLQLAGSYGWIVRNCGCS